MIPIEKQTSGSFVLLVFLFSTLFYHGYKRQCISNNKIASIFPNEQVIYGFLQRNRFLYAILKGFVEDQKCEEKSILVSFQIPSWEKFYLS